MTRPVCPLDLRVGATYRDAIDGSTFTVKALEVRGVKAKVTDSNDNQFNYGGLYRGLSLAAPAVTEAMIANAVVRSVCRCSPHGEPDRLPPHGGHEVGARCSTANLVARAVLALLVERGLVDGREPVVVHLDVDGSPIEVGCTVEQVGAGHYPEGSRFVVTGFHETPYSGWSVEGHDSPGGGIHHTPASVRVVPQPPSLAETVESVRNAERRARPGVIR